MQRRCWPPARTTGNQRRDTGSADRALIGFNLYSQYLVLDPPANTFDWTISNAYRTVLGGYR